MLYLVEKYDTAHRISAVTADERAHQLQWLFFQASGQGSAAILIASLSALADALRTLAARTTARLGGSSIGTPRRSQARSSATRTRSFACLVCSRACSRSATGSSAGSTPLPTYLSSRTFRHAMRCDRTALLTGGAWLLLRWNSAAFGLFKKTNPEINFERDFPAVLRLVMSVRGRDNAHWSPHFL